jgi:hypothetical protein
MDPLKAGYIYAGLCRIFTGSVLSLYIPVATIVYSFTLRYAGYTPAHYVICVRLIQVTSTARLPSGRPDNSERSYLYQAVR